MKKFIATVTITAPALKYSKTRIKGVDASSQAVAEKRVRKFFEEIALKTLEVSDITVEELTPKKLAAIKETLADLEAQIAALTPIKDALEDFSYISHAPKDSSIMI